MKRIRFIINPKSGTGDKNNVIPVINSYIDKKTFQTDICITEAPGHATELSADACERGYDIVVAVGGDGSVNETAKVLVNSNTSLGIIPAGSGNGMARHLKISVNTIKAVKLLNDGKSETIDTLNVNDRFCIGTIGIGFDAYIAHLFSKKAKRGYSTYVKLVLTEFSSFKEKSFSILVDGKQYDRDCFLLTFANSSQFGNNAVIAPFANVRDGIIDISMMGKFPALAAPSLIYRLMNNTIYKSSYFNSLRGKNITVINKKIMQGHIDGEPVLFESDLNIKINPLSLKVIVPDIK